MIFGWLDRKKHKRWKTISSTATPNASQSAFQLSVFGGIEGEIVKPALHAGQPEIYLMRCDNSLSNTAMGPSKKQKIAETKAKTTKVEKPESESEANLLGLEEAEDSGLDDEFDVADVSSDEDKNSSDDDSGLESDDNIPKLKKKKNLDDGSGSFANAFNAIIGSKLKAYDRKDPILARNKSSIKKLESDKLEAKAKRALLADKRELQCKRRVTNLLPTANEPEKAREMLERERRLKKVAQRGVVKLFNAILATQVTTNHEISHEKAGQTKKEELMTEISKAKFLDLVKAAGQE